MVNAASRRGERRPNAAGSDGGASEGESEECSPSAPNTNPLLRGQKRANTLLSDYSSDDESGSADDRDCQKVASAASIWQTGELLDLSNADVKMSNIRRYLRAARSLYELQFQMKRPSAILKMKSNSYGLKSRSTFDALAALKSPLRAPQVLDDWTSLEVGLFEEAYERFGKDFHAIAEQLINKSVKDSIAFYYIWKKHGACSKTRYPEGDGNLSDDFLPEPEPDVSSETLKRMDRLRKRQIYVQDYLDAARAMYGPKPAHASGHKRHKVSDFGLQRAPCFQQALRGLPPLRLPSVLDSWTPFEIRVFEVAIECYGKEFHQIADVIGSKTCGDVIAFYYIWKNDSHYQVVKNRWEKKNEPRTSKKASAPPADSKPKCA